MKSKIIILFLFIVIINNLSFSQEQNFQPTLPQVFPVSPEAASLGKYGDIPVNLATGRVNYTVPLYTIKVNDFEWPIYLSYNYSGLLAEEDPSMVGLGWNLNATGVITRQIIGRPDEDPLGYLGSEIGKNYVVPYHNGILSNADLIKMFDDSNTGRVDTEPDKYIINANDIQGNFYFNENKMPIFVPHKNYIVQFENSLYGEITVIGDNGIIYEFNKKENTTYENLDIFGPILSYTSSWFLSKIKFPNSIDEIVFEYDTYLYQKNSFSENISRIRFGTGVLCSTIVQDGVVNVSQSETRVTSQILKKIIFPQGEVLFNSTLYNAGTSNGGAVLNSMEIKNDNNQVIEKYNFTYSNPDTEANKTLTEINKNKGSATLPYYKFEYYGTLPDNINYKSQDYWGYYNGINNVNLINGNRIASFENSVIGALKKISYPTGGYTELEYEQNQILNTIDNPLLPDCSDAFFNESKEISSNSSGNFNATMIVNIPVGQTVKVYLSASSSGLGLAEASASISGAIIASPCNPSCSTSVYSTTEIGDQLSPNNVCYFNVPEGDLILDTSAFANSGFAAASIRIEYFDPNKVITAQTTTPVGGVRILKTKDCIGFDDCVTKEYKYINEDDSPSGILLNLPFYKTKIIYGGLNGGCTVESTSSGSIIPLASFQGSPVLYKRVEILENGNENNGKRVQYFTGQKNPQNSPPFAHWDNKDWRKGQLENEKLFKKEDGLLKIKYEVNNTFQINFPLSYESAKSENKISLGVKAFRERYSFSLTYGASWLNSPLISDFRTDKSFNLPEFYQLVQTEKINFFDDHQVKEIVNYNYDTLKGFQKSILTTTNNNSSIINYKYPFEESNHPLSGKNIINSPIQVEIQVKDLVGTVLSESTQCTNYKDWGNNIILPEFVQTLKGAVSSTNTLENRIQYHLYDNKGNPVEISQSNGTPIVYLWGYQQTQPIAKIENATYAQVQSAIAASPYNTTVEAIQAISNSDNDRTVGAAGNEGVLRTALNTLRSAFPNSQVTTYTYDPLIGVTSITDPSGYTVYYVYDTFNRLQYIKNKDGEVIEQYRYNYKKEALLASTSSSSSSVTAGQSVTFTTAATGGSGNFTYKWTVSNANLNQVYTNTTGVLTLTTGSSHAPNFTAVCEVTDTQTQEVVTTTTQVAVSVGYPALSVGYISEYPSGSVRVGDYVTYMINVSGGSCNYRYVWSKTNNQSHYPLSSTVNSVDVGVTVYDCRSYTITCVVTDLTTNESFTRFQEYYVSSGCGEGEMEQ